MQVRGLQIEPAADHLVKAQWVRLADVFVIGPVMVYFGARAYHEPLWLRALMVGLGAGTIIYNGRNYVAVARHEAAHSRPTAGPL